MPGCGVLLVYTLLSLSHSRLVESQYFGAESPAQLVRSRGYLAEEHFVTTTDGYILNLVRTTNPLLNPTRYKTTSRPPVLFIHGINTNTNCFILNSRNVIPRDYSDIVSNSMSEDNLVEMLERDHGSNSLVFTALNFGHEVWLLNRRGTSYSQMHRDSDMKPYLESMERPPSTLTNLAGIIAKGGFSFSPFYWLKSFVLPGINLPKLQPSFNSRYWNYSLDEQAKYDIPEVIDYVTQLTGQAKISVVGHSAGGALILMAVSEKPELADKIYKTILWAPALDLAGTREVNTVSRIAVKNIRHLINYLGPIPPTPLSQVGTREQRMPICNRFLTRRLCLRLFDVVFGQGAAQFNLDTDAVTRTIEQISSHEFAQLVQSVESGRMRHLDFLDAARNSIIYGQPRSPIYETSPLSLNISIWYGANDILVTPRGIHDLIEHLKGPIEAHFFNGNGLLFNHISFFYHKNIAKLLIVPGIRSLESN